MSDSFFDDDTFFFVPERRLFEDFVSAVCDDEEPDLEPAENVFDDVVSKASEDRVEVFIYERA